MAFGLATLLTSCGSTLPAFDASLQPPAPNYANEAHWSALPFRKDAADVVPYGETWISDSLKKVDVFYIYPTLYRKGDVWCAALDDKKLNKQIDKLPVRLHAGVFSAVGRTYAPRYRQAHVDAFFSEHREEGSKALGFAYEDVKAAFEYYLKHYNNGRPIIIASHSQGTWHARKLLAEYFDDGALKAQLVCAYVVGYAIYPDEYSSLRLCQTPTETQCYVTWSSFKEGYEYPDTAKDLLTGKAVVNPITWTTNSSPATTDGAVLLNPSKKRTWSTSAYIHRDWLWVDTKLIFMRNRKTLHLVDYNLFWHSIRTNAADRVDAYLR